MHSTINEHRIYKTMPSSPVASCSSSGAKRLKIWIQNNHSFTSSTHGIQSRKWAMVRIESDLSDFKDSGHIATMNLEAGY